MFPPNASQPPSRTSQPPSQGVQTIRYSFVEERRVILMDAAFSKLTPE